MTGARHEGREGEEFVTWASGKSFFADFVFANPPYRKGKTQKELCDALVLFENMAVVIQVKTASTTTKQSYSAEEATDWANRRITEAIAQIKGAVRAIRAGLITEVRNSRQGSVSVDPKSISEYYGIAVVDRPDLEVYGHTPIIASPDGDVSVLVLRHDEFLLLTEELGTLGDIKEYLEFRRKASRSLRFSGNTELDILACFQTQYPAAMKALEVDDFFVASGVWGEFSKREEKAKRDQQNAAARIVDLLANRLHDTYLHPPDHRDFEAIDARTAPRAEQYIFYVRELAKIRRIGRRSIGEKILEKDRLYVPGERPRYFCHCHENACPMLFMISDAPRDARLDLLHDLCLGAKRVARATQMMGFAISSSRAKGFSMDCTHSRTTWEEDAAADTEGWIEECAEHFAPGEHGSDDEWKRIREDHKRRKANVSKPGFTRFKCRNRRSR